MTRNSKPTRPSPTAAELGGRAAGGIDLCQYQNGSRRAGLVLCRQPVGGVGGQPAVQRSDRTRGVFAPVMPQPEAPLPHGLRPPACLVLAQPAHHFPVHVAQVVRQAPDNRFVGRYRERVEHLTVEVERQPTARRRDRPVLLVADPW